MGEEDFAYINQNEAKKKLFLKILLIHLFTVE